MFGPYGSKESLLAPLRRFLDKHEAKQQQLAGAAHGLHRRTRLALRTGTAHPCLLGRERARAGALVDGLTTAPVACGEVTLRQHANENGCDSVSVRRRAKRSARAWRSTTREREEGSEGARPYGGREKGPSLGAALQSLFQFLHVPRCPPLCLPLRDERDEQPADPVTPKVELVRDAATGDRRRAALWCLCFLLGRARQGCERRSSVEGRAPQSRRSCSARADLCDASRPRASRPPRDLRRSSRCGRHPLAIRADAKGP